MYSEAITKILGYLPQLGGVQAEIASLALYGVAVLILISVFDYLYGWFERKVMAKTQFRHGPNTVGKYGILQNLADIVKLLSKEEIVPKNANRYILALGVPIMLWLMVFLVMLVPLSGGIYGVDTGVSMLLIFVLLSFSPLLVFITGWATGNKFASVSSQRSVMMLISYELPMLIVIVAVGIAAKSFSLISIVNAQAGMPFAAVMPIGFIIFLIALLAELERPPFDIREADSELIAGWLTDVSAPYYAQALFIDYTRVLLGSLLVSILFLGGWTGPVLPGVAWMAIKVLAVAFTLILVRVSTVRMRIDKLLRLGWTYMVPLAMLNLLIVSALYIGVI